MTVATYEKSFMFYVMFYPHDRIWNRNNLARKTFELSLSLEVCSEEYKGRILQQSFLNIASVLD